MNHLGNVLVSVSDKKKYNAGGWYEADVVSASDYYPFGMQMPGRNLSASGYRYGFNGKENDNDVKGGGNQQDYGMRIYDPRLGRFLSVDPLTKKYPELTPYQFASNTPIQGVDLDGKELLKATLGFFTGNMNIASSALAEWYANKTNEYGGSLDAMNRLATNDYTTKTSNPLANTQASLNKLSDQVKMAAPAIDAVDNVSTLASAIPIEGIAAVGIESLMMRTIATKVVANNVKKQAVESAASAALKIPQGLSENEFMIMSQNVFGQVGNLSENVVVQGSRASGTALAKSDIDIAIKLSSEDFSKFLGQQFKNVNVGSAKEKTFIHAFQTGKVQAGEAGLSGLRKKLEKLLGIEVDISVIKEGGAFDNGAQIPLKRK